MMLGGSAKAYVCAEPVDMRKSIDGLAQLVAPLLRGDAFSGSVFVFLSRRREKVKLLWWDRHGFWLAYNQLSSHYTSFGFMRAIRAARSTSWFHRLHCLIGGFGPGCSYR